MAAGLRRRNLRNALPVRLGPQAGGRFARGRRHRRIGGRRRHARVSGLVDHAGGGRGAILHRLADLIDANIERLAIVECMDMAMLHESLRLRVIARGALNFRNYADLATDYRERVWSSRGTANRVIRMPSGPSVIITPWNAPFMLSTWKCAPALAAGNTVILKPAEWSPLSASVLADLIEQAGFPPGVFNIVQGFGRDLGMALVSDPRVKRISFTGSVPTARVIGRAAAENIVPFTAELGGKSPLLVFADADIDAAAKAAGAIR
jgi:betaine-aldehyde dehydrogenase/5-carboxymethyl-2-hydroxymuconic-semialdehyde dehydrogenase